MIRILLLCVLSMFIAIGFGQQSSIPFQRYYSKDGLSSNTIYSILRDSHGFLWLGTEDGLNRFDGRRYTVYRYDANKENSLMANHITALCEDKKGRIWIGTNGGGLSYYDSNIDTIHLYSKTPGGKEVSTAINSIEKDARGNIWIASYGALFVVNVDKLHEKVDKKYAAILNLFEGKVSSSVFRDSQNNMWVSSESSLFQISPDLQKVRKFDVLSKSDGYVDGVEIMSITEDQQGRIWMGSMLGLKYLDKGQHEFRPFKGSPERGLLSSSRIYALRNDPRGGLWVGTDNGLDIVNTADFSVQRIKPDVNDIHSLSHKSIRSICIDHRGIYWVGTFQGGLNKFDMNVSQFRLKSLDLMGHRSLDAGMVTSFAADQNRIFLGVDGGGVWAYERSLDRLKPFTIAADLPPDLTVLALERQDNDLWIGTYQQGVIVYHLKSNTSKRYVAGVGDKNLNNNDVFCLKRDYRGNMWVGTNGGGVNIIGRDGLTVKKYRRSTVSDGGAGLLLSGDYIRAFEEDNFHRMWMGFYGAGLCVYDPVQNKTKIYNKANSKLPSNYILAIRSDRKGNIWVGTNGNGVGLLSPHANSFVTLSEKDGLVNGAVQSIVEDDDGKMWFATNKGLSCYDPKVKKFKNYTDAVGLQEGAFMLGSALKLSDGEIYFGGQKGFNHFYSKNLKMNVNPADVVFTELKIDNAIVRPAENGPIKQSLLTAERIYLRYKQNFSLSFAALNLTVPEDNQYEYRLIGFDNNWINNGKGNSVYYTNLDPGEYTFQVRASNNDGLWNKDIKSITIIVDPPFYRTTVAYILYVLSFFGLLFAIRRRGIQKLKQKFALEHERLQARQLIEQQRIEAETMHKLDTLKIKFLTNLSHEFRTPISLIVGPIDNLMAKNKDITIANQLGLIRRNAQRLLNLVNQLLDFRKMEYKELTLQEADGELVSFIKDVFDSFNDMASQKGIDYSFMSCHEKLYCRFDQDKIERILFNLISNAFKFTDREGDIAVCISSMEYTPDRAHVCIEVRDTGIGMPKEIQKAIFDSFFQYDADSMMAAQGSGIGLSIAQSFVHMYKGNIEVESTLHEGSTFRFDLWLNLVETSDVLISEPIGTDVAYPAESRLSPLVLVIEDDDDFRYYLKDSLQEHYQVIEADNGKDGWQKALFHHPDLVVSDVQMPYLNGMEFAQKLTQDRRTKHIPVVLLTASRVDNGLVCGFESGAVGYLTKPFDMQVLLAKINSLLTLNQAFKDVYSKQVSIVSPTVEVTSEKDKFLQKILAYVYENMDNPQLSVETLSAHISMSRASLYNKLLEITGMSPVDFIRSVKLERAAGLLEKSDKTISEIAYETGFANPNYFTKVFKAKYQMTPSEYIQMKRNIQV